MILYGHQRKKIEGKIEKGYIQPGVIEDIYELRFQYEMAKTKPVYGIENTVNIGGIRNNTLGK